MNVPKHGSKIGIEVVHIAQFKNIKLNGIYEDLAAVMPLEYVLLLYQQYRGTQITFPKRLYDSDAMYELIREEYDGTNLKALSKKYGYSERWIRLILSNNKNAPLKLTV